ncbi:MAG: hypothetical protein EOM80_06770, partial [Erysipelotrichia bacterium]|nr:hypothetical protein [Erysipelotrichia bacterium]
MKFLTRKFLPLLTAFFALFLVLVGCGNHKQSQPQPDATSAEKNEKASIKQSEANTTYLSRFKFKTTDGSEALSIKRYADHDKIEISFEGLQTTFKGRTDRPDRVKYKTIDNENN